MNDDVISRQQAINEVDSETVSTNPDHFKSSEKFIKFMDDSDIASFGKWQWANGFNTALVAIRVQLKKLPSAQPEPKWIPCSRRLPKKVGDYLVTTHNGQIARYIYMDTDSSKEYWMRCAVAWMSLPKPYKGEEDA